MIKHVKNKRTLQEENKFKRKEDGITLIALVITIIVLLILAGVTIATLTGENGILTKAQQAKTETEKAEEYELRKLTQGEAATYLEEHEYTDVNGEKVTIPAKCAVSQVEGENTLEDGLVIIDANGNEWVWVEVPRAEEVYQNAGINLDVNNITDEQCNIIYEDLDNYASAYRDSNYSDTFYSTKQGGFSDANEYNTAKNDMLRSVYKNGGFWIGRYEVGIENSYRSYGDDYTTEHPITETPVIKVNAYPYNYVRCSQAQTLSKQLSIGGKTGSLMFGIQWDLTCKFLETKGGLSQEELKGGDGVENTNWSNWGNNNIGSITLLRGKYNKNPVDTNSQWLDVIQGKKNGQMLLTTGASDDTRKMNIYDFAGNEWEWTLEYTGDASRPCIARGGCFNSISSPAIERFRALGNRNSFY